MADLPLGYDPETGITRWLPAKDRFAGTYIAGVQGAGKSGFLTNLIVADCTAKKPDGTPENAVIVEDPHGDLIDDCVARLPHDCLHRVSVLDMEDEEWPFELNAFAEAGTFTTEVERAAATEDIYHIFEVLWPEIETQQYLPMLLKAAVAVFLDNPGVTLVDMLRFFRDKSFRDALMANCTNPMVAEDFALEYDNLKPEQQATMVRPLMNRLRSLFVVRTLPRNILGQRKQRLNLRRCIERKEILFVKLPTTNMRSDAQLVGTILMGQISSAIFSFKDTRLEDRPGVSVYVDEFQNFATPDFARIFSEARKFGARLTIAHQYRAQLPGYLQESTVTARTKVFFRVKPDDATAFGRLFPAQAGEFTLIQQVTKELRNRAADFPPAVAEFAETYLMTLPMGGSEVVIKHVGGAVENVLFNQGKPVQVKKPSPVRALDTLFYKVMVTGDPNLPLDPEMIAGLANGGRDGFFPAWRWSSSRLFTDDVSHLPRHLVRRTHDGWEWTREPEDQKEQLLHCIFHLRMTMAYLASNPIGTEKAATNDKAAQMLTQLPNRCAFVSGSEGAYVIWTHDTAPGVEGVERAERFRMIRDQTRARYCHRREEIARQDQPAAASSEQTASVGRVALSRSEEV